MFYNTENFFDPSNDPNTSDDDFTPQGRQNWTYKKYNTKLVNIFKVIAGVGEGQPPYIIGLCEIENKKVLTDLITLTPLSKFKYGIIHFDSPDPRGIDVALLYRSDVLKLLDFNPINIDSPSNLEDYKFRNILTARFLVNHTDTLIVFANHWPSRRRGEKETDELRMIVAKELNKAVNLAFSRNKSAKIIIIGDLNDEPSDQSLTKGLQANVNMVKILPGQLCNMSAFYKSSGSSGTHKYNGKWEIFDQIIISGALLCPNKGLYTDDKSVKIYDPSFLLRPDEKNLGQRPFPTYSGYKYLGGYSDHLPVYIDLFLGK